MAHPIFRTPRELQYPIGNTSPISYTEYFSPEEDAAILALGCGDPRNLLYTIYADSPFKRTLDFTFCETQPNVLARNVLIYTLLFDGCDSQRVQSVWKLWFDIFIDKASLDLLRSQSATLLDFSTDIDKWNSSPYGSFIKFCTSDTLSALRQRWAQYQHLPGGEQGPQSIPSKAEVLGQMKALALPTEGTNARALSMRSAGALAQNARKMSIEHMGHYWETGVTDVDAAELKKATHINSTLVDLRGKVNMHYGTDLMCFHLAPLLAGIAAGSNPLRDTAGVLAGAKTQFGEWCKAFHRRLKARNAAGRRVILRIFVGNAMSFSRALQSVAQGGSLDTAEYTDVWRGTTIHFTSDYHPSSSSSSRAPLSFDVIDTSNLFDHLGSLNTLLTTVPLLERHPSSALLTASLGGPISTGNEGKSILRNIGVEPPLLCLILGVVPERAVSCTTAQSVAHEFMLRTAVDGPVRFSEFNLWRASGTAETAYTFECPNPKELCSVLYMVFLALLDGESFENLKNPNPKLQHNTRSTFVQFLSLVKQAYTGSWPDLMDKFNIFLVTQTNHRLHQAQMYHLELMMYLDLAGLRPLPIEQRLSPPPSKIGGCFEGWSGDIPKFVCLALVVPRARLKEVLNKSAEGKTAKTPMLQCGVYTPTQGMIAVTDFQAVFGSIVDGERAGGERELVIREDLAGWDGSSDMIVHFTCPSWYLSTKKRPEYEVSLGMYGLLATSSFRSLLGPELQIFKTTLDISNPAFVLRERPRVESQLAVQGAKVKHSLSNPNQLDFHSGVKERVPVVLKLDDGEKVKSFTIRWSISEQKAKAALATKTTVVDVDSLSLTTVKVSFADKFSHTFHFPYPIKTGPSGLTTRIARKSSYIEVEALVTEHPNAYTTYNLDPFPIVPTAKGFHALAMPYLPLNILPSIRLALPRQPTSSNFKRGLGWFYNYLQVITLERERHLNLLSSTTPPDPGLKKLGNSLMLLLYHYTENQCRPYTVQLEAPNGIGIWAVIFVNAVKFDLTTHSLVADVCVLPVTFAVLMEPGVMEALVKMHASNRPYNVVLETDLAEVRWWKRYMPSAVERCRMWSHNPGQQCERPWETFKEGTFGWLDAPPGTTTEEGREIIRDSICLCGRGVNLGEFDKVKEWAVFRDWMVRAAMGTMLPVSLLGQT